MKQKKNQISYQNFIRLKKHNFSTKNQSFNNNNINSSNYPNLTNLTIPELRASAKTQKKTQISNNL